VDEVSEREAAFYERLYVLEEGLQLFDSLYATFLAARLDSGWVESWGGSRGGWRGSDAGHGHNGKGRTGA